MSMGLPAAVIDTDVYSYLFVSEFSKLLSADDPAGMAASLRR